MTADYEEHARVFRALCDEKRLRILELLRGGEKCACVLLKQLDLGQSGLSYHMKILIESGVVNARREGLWTKYSINDETFNRAMDFLPELYKLKDKCVCQQIKYVKNPERQELGGADEFGN